ncbi:hypothetical protein J3R83DRAFT_10110 [Lanmaoa asiatica]|nr:hypothetical protein J3R83DRAFT_10110 [Lanmaoa asiatica]
MTHWGVNTDTQKRTSKPIQYQLVGSEHLAYSVRNLEKGDRSIDYAALGIQGFTSLFLLLRMKDVNEAAVGTFTGSADSDLDILVSSHVTACTIPSRVSSPSQKSDERG